LSFGRAAHGLGKTKRNPAGYQSKSRLSLAEEAMLEVDRDVADRLQYRRPYIGQQKPEFEANRGCAIPQRMHGTRQFSLAV
jgi:hypothetical protein